MHGAAATLLVCLGLLWAVNSQNPKSHMVMVTKAHSGKEITVKLGDVIRIELPEQGGTGFLWQFEGLDKQFFDLIKVETDKMNKEEGLTGEPLVKRWHLKTKKVGTTVVRLYYFRPWEHKGKAADTFVLPVRIQNHIHGGD